MNMRDKLVAACKAYQDLDAKRKALVDELKCVEEAVQPAVDEIARVMHLNGDRALVYNGQRFTKNSEGILFVARCDDEIL
jgi:hypothetical protein